MTKDIQNTAASSRALRSARVLKAYFEHKLKISLELLTEAPSEPLQAGLQFDMQVGSWGIWGLKSSEVLPDKVQSEISAGFHSLFTAIDSSEKREYDLAVLQDRFERATKELPSNVIPLFQKRVPDAITRPFAKVRDTRWALKQDCLIESESLSDIHKMAVELHEHSKRFAFLHFADLNRETRMNLSELISLGHISLFVPDIMQLTLQEQTTLHQLLSHTEASEGRPLLMVGANTAYSDLRSEPAIHLDFLLLLARAYIKLTRPFSEYKDEGLIHYFLDSLAQNPT